MMDDWKLKTSPVVSLLFTFCMRHCYLPATFMDSVILPQVKNKCGDLTDVDNYRAIALSNAETKIFETIILRHINEMLMTTQICINLDSKRNILLECAQVWPSVRLLFEAA